MILQLLPAISEVISKIIPDPQAAAQAKIKLMELEQQGVFKQVDADLQLATSQMEINKIEAQSPSKFKSWWRPAVAWICTIGLAYATVILPILQWVVVIYGIPAPPAIDTSLLLTILGGLLGLGGYRTYEKFTGLTK